MKERLRAIDERRLNRTFYGIEIEERFGGHESKKVLIVPFMELKYGYRVYRCTVCGSLNRTFYGIEIGLLLLEDHILVVLIVPFMELKLRGRRAADSTTTVLIVPFMELKWRS